MSRLSFLFTTITVIVLGALVYYYTRHDGWRPLPGGGEIRLVAVTYAKNAQGKIGGSVFEPLRNLLGPRWGHFLGPPPQVFDYPSDRPRLVTLFTTRFVVKDHLSPEHFLLLSGGAEMRPNLFSYTNLAATEGSKEVACFGFDWPPSTEPRLRIRFERNGQTLDFDAANPCYSASEHSQPNAEPVPLTPPPMQLQGALKYGLPVPGKPGYVTSPFAPASGDIDVRDFPPGTQVRCPYTQNLFLVP